MLSLQTFSQNQHFEFDSWPKHTTKSLNLNFTPKIHKWIAEHSNSVFTWCRSSIVWIFSWTIQHYSLVSLGKLFGAASIGLLLVVATTFRKYWHFTNSHGWFGLYILNLSADALAYCLYILYVGEIYSSFTKPVLDIIKYTQFKHIMYSNYYLFTNTYACVACREKHFHRSSFIVSCLEWSESANVTYMSDEQQCKGYMCELNLFLVSFTYIKCGMWECVLSLKLLLLYVYMYIWGYEIAR